MSVKLGRFNKLEVYSTSEIGVFLDGENLGRILLPSRYAPNDCDLDDDIDVFIYHDTEGRLVATTQIPFVQVGEFAFLEVSWVNEYGAFLNWGLMKDLFAPFSEQKEKMEIGKKYLIYAYIDDESGRIVASSKIERFFVADMPEYNRNEEIDILISGKTEKGYRAIVDNKYKGMLYQTFQPVEIGDRMKAYIDKVRQDGKIDLYLNKPGFNGIGDLSAALLTYLKGNGGFTPMTDKSDPELIYNTFGVSKKAFKKAVGDLYKKGLIILEENGIKLY